MINTVTESYEHSVYMELQQIFRTSIYNYFIRKCNNSHEYAYCLFICLKSSWVLKVEGTFYCLIKVKV